MLPHRMQSVRPVHYRTAIDAKLMEKTGLDEFTLRRVRKIFMLRYARLSYGERRWLAENGICVRFAMLNGLLRWAFQQEAWAAWLAYLEHSDQDIDDMALGEYPISPYLVRVYSALFGMKVDFLLLGSAPVADRIGANIDVWPLTVTR